MIFGYGCGVSLRPSSPAWTREQVTAQAAGSALGRVLGALRSQGVRAAAIGSQGAAVLQAASILGAFGAGRLADAFNLLWVFATAPMAVLARGVLLPYAMVRPAFSRWRVLTVGAGVVGALLAPAGALYLESTGLYFGVQMWTLGGAFALLGATLSMVSVRAARLACEGRPVAIAAVTIPINLCLALAAWLPWGMPEMRLLLAVALGGGLQTVVVWRIRVRPPSADEVNLGLPPNPSQARSLTWGALVGYLGPTVLQSMAAVLPPGQLTILGLASKVLGAIVNFGVGAAMLESSNWASVGAKPLRRFLTALAGSTSVVCLSAALLLRDEFWQLIAVGFLVWFSLASWSLIVIKWLQLEGHSRAIRLSAWASFASYLLAVIYFAHNRTAAGFVFSSALPLVASVLVCERYLSFARAAIAAAVGIVTFVLVERGFDAISMALAAVVASCTMVWLYRQLRSGGLRAG